MSFLSAETNARPASRPARTAAVPAVFYSYIDVLPQDDDEGALQETRAFTQLIERLAGPAKAADRT